MKITQPQKLIKDENNHHRVLEDIHKMTRGNITFGNMTQGDVGQNIKGAPVEVTTGAANTEFTVTHNLNEIPTGFLILNKNKAGDFYGTPSLGTPWNTKQIYLKCSVATVTAQIFVLA